MPKSNSKTELDSIEYFFTRLLWKCLTFIFLFHGFNSSAQISASSADVYETAITLRHAPLQSIEIPVIIVNQDLFISLTDLFDYLKIHHTLSGQTDILSGFISNPDDTFQIHLINHQLEYQGMTINLPASAVQFSQGFAYMLSSTIDEIFGIQSTYNLRSLSAETTSHLELPAVKALRLEQSRLRFHRSDINFNPDTTIRQRFRLFHLGALDWSLNGTLQSNNQGQLRIGISLGGELLGGELRGTFIHRMGQPLIPRQQHYAWRYVNNSNKVIRQITAGKIATQPITSIFSPIIGAQITNSPTYRRGSFGEYTYSDQTLPDCMIEVYVNNNLIEYIRSDGSGFFKYSVPLSYGITSLRFRVYGPHGEEFELTKFFEIPFTFLPVNTLEYTLSSGFIEDGTGNLFAQGRFNYGLTDRITIGGGQEYLYYDQIHQNLSFLTASFILDQGLFATGEYVEGVRYKGGLTFRSPKQFQFELYYSKYNAHQEIVRFNYIESRKASFSFPVKLNKTTVFSKTSFSQNLNGHSTLNILEWQLSLSARKLNVYYMHRLLAREDSETHMNGILTLSLRLPGQITITPRARFNYSAGKMQTLSTTLEKRFSKGLSVNASMEHSFEKSTQYFRLGFRYDIPFARLSSNITYHNTETQFGYNASGSILLDNEPHPFHFSKQSNVNRGGVAFSAFLDLNANGIKDKNEPKIKGLDVRLHRGGGKKTRTDSTYVITGLEAHAYHHFTVNGHRFDHIAWTISNPALSILIEPNQIKRIDIPVVPVGEVAGMAFRTDATGQNGIGRIKINFYDAQQQLIASTLSESDGYFSHLGLKPGTYTASVDETQMELLQMTASPKAISIILKPNIDGDIIDDLEFFIENLSGE